MSLGSLSPTDLDEHLTSVRSRHKSSKFRGVSKCSKDGRWQARIRVGKVVKYLGRFSTQEEAAAAYDRGALQYHGQRAVTNFDRSRYGQIEAIPTEDVEAEVAEAAEKRRVKRRKRSVSEESVETELKLPQLTMVHPPNSKADDQVLGAFGVHSEFNPFLAQFVGYNSQMSHLWSQFNNNLAVEMLRNMQLQTPIIIPGVSNAGTAGDKKYEVDSSDAIGGLLSLSSGGMNFH